MINEQLARQLWPNVADPTGQRMIWNGDTTTTQLDDGRRRREGREALRPRGSDDPRVLPVDDGPDTTAAAPSFGVAVRATTTEAAVAAAARAIVRQLDPELPLIELQSAQAALNRSIANRRTIAFAFAAFGAVALALALGGIYAVLSYVVGPAAAGDRDPHGARRAARPGRAARRAAGAAARGARRADRPAARAAGAAGLSSLLVGVSARDPLTYVVAMVLLAGTAVVSALIPARQGGGGGSEDGVRRERRVRE